ncbi:MAG: hypothetical protein GX323_01770 [Clostridiales bacterium]|nr:hypothetical protein [Clostridiales bacterium]
MRLRDRFYQFMQGRYGVDQFSKFLTYGGIILMIISNFFGGLLLNSLGLLMVIYAYFRMFSKNISKRYQENQKYLHYASIIKRSLNVYKRRFAERKTHRIFKCPSCKQKIRVPKGKGKIEITCPKCRTKFIRKS